MKRKRNFRFRYYATVPLTVRLYVDYYCKLDKDEFDQEEKVEKIEFDEELLPRAYWREGTYLFSSLKIFPKEERKGVFGHSTYQGLFYYRNNWYVGEETESDLQRVNLPYLGSKEFEFLMQIPPKMLGKYWRDRQYFLFKRQEFLSCVRNSRIDRWKRLGK